MDTNKFCLRVCILLLYFTIVATSITPCDARKTISLFKGRKHAKGLIVKQMKKLKVMKHLDGDVSIDSSNTDPYLSSPFSLPPFDSLGPISLPDFAPPFCTFPPFTPQPPSTTIPTPAGSTLPAQPLPPPPPPPPPPYYYIPPILPIYQSPPPSPSGASISPPQTIPSPPTYMVSPPDYTEPSPPYYEPSPPSYYLPNPPYGFAPSPPVFQPPVVYPPPTGPPPRNRAPNMALWCVAKPSVPDPIIQEAMNYACVSGADCESIQPNSACFEPNTLYAHASYAFNSYWQRTKVAGGTCEFGGTAILVTVDPSYDGCHFLYY